MLTKARQRRWRCWIGGAIGRVEIIQVRCECGSWVASAERARQVKEQSSEQSGKKVGQPMRA